jgi:hypothetical protein
MNKIRSHIYLIISFPLLLSACRNNDQQLFKKLSSDHTHIDFSNSITENDSVNILSYYYCYNGGGVGLADFDNDGLTDIFFTGNMVSSRLYLNKGSMNFEDITEEAGLTTSTWIMGVSVADINNDGWMDIYLNVAGPRNAAIHHNLLYINQGNADGKITFREEAAAYGLADSSFCVQSAFFDYDRDGDLDMYLLTNNVDGVEKTFIHPASYPVTRGITADRLYENLTDSQGHPYYINVSDLADVKKEGYGLGLTVNDFNCDGWPDVYVANDFMPDDQLLINQKNKTFRESARESMPHQSYSGMGVDAADINNDGMPDIAEVDMLPENNERRKTMIARTDNESFVIRQKSGYIDQYMRNTLQLNQGSDQNGITHFSDIAQFSGIHATDWSWAVLLADFDNDGWRDGYITNGFAKNITDLDFMSYNTDNNTFGTREEKYKRTSEMLGKLKGIQHADYIFRNNGNLGFENKSTSWGIDDQSYSNGAAYADLDNDGDLDLVLNNINEKATILENIAAQKPGKNNYLQISLKGSDKNKNGIGAAISLYCKNQLNHAYVSPVKGYLSSMNTSITIGLGKYKLVDSLRITWPDGKSALIQNLPVNRMITLDYKSADSISETAIPGNPIFSNANELFNIHYRHIENEFNDFSRESLLTGINSKKGPGLAFADINNKNGVDFFIGGASGQPGTIFTQIQSGQFEAKPLNPEEAGYEDMGALFIDADNDKDADLYIVSGGAAFNDGSSFYQDRLYLNDGNGNFTRGQNVLPVTVSGGSSITGADFDKDGDIDLFRAGSNLAGFYPLPARSYLLQNDKGKFSDITNESAPGLMYAGVINAAVWTDFDNDSWVDLIVVGEWMPPMIFKNEHGKLVQIKNTGGLENTNGWWNSIYPLDIDKDGDIDYVLGNMGTNIDYKPSPKKPMELFYHDFDGNGKQEAVISTYITDERGIKKRFPLPFRDDLFRELPFLKKKYWNYDLYSRATLDEIFSNETLENAKHFQTDLFESCILENKGAGKFILKPLPAEAQLSCMNGITSTDYNKDGNIDLVIAGNAHTKESMYGWMDASLGLLLQGDGKGSFIPVPAIKSGLFLNKDVRGLAEFYDLKGQPALMVVNNADSLEVMATVESSQANFLMAGWLDDYAILYYKDGHTIKKEFYYGYGYLVQEQRLVIITEDMKEIQWFDSKGNKRISIL